MNQRHFLPLYHYILLILFLVGSVDSFATNSNIIKIYEGKGAIYFDTVEKKSNVLVADEEYIHFIERISSDNNWVILSALPLKGGEGRISEIRELYYIPKKIKIDSSIIGSPFNPLSGHQIGIVLKY